MKNTALAQWRAKQKSTGIWSNLPDIHLAELLGRSGADWICFDLQHGLMDYSALTHLLPAVCGLPITPLVRVAANQPEQIGKALDVGAHGVIVPMVNTAEEAHQAATACRYPPDGLRSCGPMRDSMLEGFDYLESANNEIACIAMIETTDGLANVDSIAGVDGVDALFVGPMDLCYGLGLTPGDFDNPKFRDAIAAILAACESNQCAAGMFGYTPALAAKSLAEGFDFASIGTDISFARTGMSQALRTVQGDTHADTNKKNVGY